MNPLFCFVAAFFLSAGACLILAKIAPRIGLMDAPNQPRKSHPRPVPLAGGIAIWLSITVMFLLVRQQIQWPIWVGITAMGIVGLVDDWIDLSVLTKLFCQILAAILLWYFGIRVTLFVRSQIMSLLFTVAWFVWVTNAFNYMDNSNELCAGVGGITLGGIAAIHLVSGDNHMEMHSLIAVGSIGGFLFWNFPKGLIFLGDNGSLFIGASVATLMMQTTFVHVAQEQPPWAVSAAFLLILVPLIDFVQVTVGRLRRGQPIWQADNHHLAHLLIRKGHTPARAVLILWLAPGVCVMSAVLIERWSL